MKYTANYNANNGTTMMTGISFTSKKEAIASIREIAVGNTYAGNEFSWWVMDENCDEIARGGGKKSTSGKVSYYRVY
jgi:uncharacterized protein YegP (UPF0339 family)